MSESLGKFVIDLEARIATLESDLGRAERIATQKANAMQAKFEEAFKRIEEKAHASVEGIGEAFQSLTGLSIAQLGVGAIVAGLGELTKKALETGEALNKLSQKTGIGVEALSGIAYAAQLADVPLDALGASMGKFSKFAADAANGGKDSSAAFAALGINVKNADGSIRPMDALLADLATKFSGYKDGVEKTAAAQTFFGKSGAQLIPLLNSGAAGIAKASAEARALGYDFTGTAKNAEEFNDGLKKLTFAAVGLGNDIARELLPSLISAEQHVLDFIKAMRENGAIQAFASGVAFLAKNLDTLAVIFATRIAFGAIVSGFTAMAGAASFSALAVGGLEAAFAALGGPVGVVALLVGGLYFLSTRQTETEKTTDALTEATKRLKDATGDERREAEQSLLVQKRLADSRLKEAEAVLAQIEAKNLAADKANENLKLAGGGENNFSDNPLGMAVDNQRKQVEKLRAALADANREISIADALEDMFGEDAKKATPNVVGLGKAMEEAGKKAAKLANDSLEAQKFLDTLAGQLGGQYTQAASKYSAALDEAAKMAAKFRADGESAGKVQKFIADATQLATQRFQEETDAGYNIDKVLGSITGKYTEQNRLLGLSGQALEVETEYLRLKAEADKALLGVMGPLTEAQQRQLDSLHALAEAHVALSEKAKLDQETQKEFVGIWSTMANSAVDSFAKILVEGGSLLDGLKSIAKQTVEAIISYFAKLAIINPILNAVFGGSGGFSALPTLANSALSAAGGGASGGAGGASAGGGFDLSSASGLFSAGRSLFGGFSSAASTFWGGSATNPASANFMGPPVEGQTFGPQYGGYSSGLQQGLGAAAAIYAGYNRYKASGGGLAGAAGGVTYAAGTYALGAGISSAVAGTGFAAGVSGAFAAIPVVGWIALAAMLIDHFSGGKLFGTAYQTKASTQTISIGPDGGTASAFLSQSRQGALFSGTKWREKGVDPGQDARDAASAFFDSIKKEMTTAAAQLGVEVAPVIAAGISTVTEYDKKGHAKSTKYLVDAIGKQWTETTADLAAMRVQAEAMIAQIDASAGGQASAIADQWRTDAQKLADGAQFLLAAQVDITKQEALWKGADLTGTTKIVQQLTQGSETLLQTYARLQAQTKFAEQAFDAIGVTIKQTGADFVTFADSLASAAGGLDSLAQEWDAYYKAYYSDGERAAQSMAMLHKSATDALAAIGESGVTSLAQFRADFEAYLKGSPTADGIQKWLEAANAFATATSAQESAAQAYDQFIAQFDSSTKDFAHALLNLGQSIASNINQANALALANGKAGASAADLGKIITASVSQGAAMLAQLESDTADLAGQMFGTSLDQLKAQVAAFEQSTGLIDIPGEQQIRDIETQRTKQQQFAAASQLLGNFGQIGAVTEQSLGELAAMFGVPLDKLADMLGTDLSGLSKDFDQQVASARAALETAGNTKYTNELLADIRAQLAGDALPFSPEQLAADAINKPNTLSPGGTVTSTDLGAPELVKAVNDGTKQQADDADATQALLQTAVETLKTISRQLGGPDNRNQRSLA
jgi:hypothetical protein